MHFGRQLGAELSCDGAYEELERLGMRVVLEKEIQFRPQAGKGGARSLQRGDRDIADVGTRHLYNVHVPGAARLSPCAPCLTGDPTRPLLGFPLKTPVGMAEDAHNGRPTDWGWATTPVSMLATGRTRVTAVPCVQETEETGVSTDTKNNANYGLAGPVTCPAAAFHLVRSSVGNDWPGLAMTLCPLQVTGDMSTHP